MRRNAFNHLMEYGLLLLLSAFILSSCSQDEPEVIQGTKAEILMAKAKEFAQKYGVEVNLNTENIDSIAEVLTVEQMEEDFKMFATLLKEQSSLPFTQKPSGVKIRRSTSLEEETTPEEERYKIYSGQKELTKVLIMRDDSDDSDIHYLDLTVKIEWKFGNQCSNLLKFETSAEYDYSKCDTKNTLTGVMSANNGFEITASGAISVTTPKYIVTYRNCIISYKEKLNSWSFSL